VRLVAIPCAVPVPCRLCHRRERLTGSAIRAPVRAAVPSRLGCPCRCPSKRLTGSQGAQARSAQAHRRTAHRRTRRTGNAAHRLGAISISRACPDSLCRLGSAVRLVAIPCAVPVPCRLCHRRERLTGSQERHARLGAISISRACPDSLCRAARLSVRLCRCPVRAPVRPCRAPVSAVRRLFERTGSQGTPRTGSQARLFVRLSVRAACPCACPSTRTAHRLGALPYSCACPSVPSRLSVPPVRAAVRRLFERTGSQANGSQARQSSAQARRVALSVRLSRSRSAQGTPRTGSARSRNGSQARRDLEAAHRLGNRLGCACPDLD
jgi:hypothetical protein